LAWQGCSLQIVPPYLEDGIHFLLGDQAVELQAMLVKIGDKYEDLVQDISIQVEKGLQITPKCVPAPQTQQHAGDTAATAAIPLRDL